jgi:protein subunit release factor A
MAAFAGMFAGWSELMHYWLKMLVPATTKLILEYAENISAAPSSESYRYDQGVHRVQSQAYEDRLP